MSVRTLVAPPHSSDSSQSEHTGGHAAHPRTASPNSIRYDADEHRIELWSPWYGRRRPCTAIEEARFVERLRELAAMDTRSPASWMRHDVTALVTALRTALTAEEMLERAPGLEPRILLAAYDELEARRAGAAGAWSAIVAAPGMPSIEAYGAQAGLLLPVAISHLRALRLRRSDDLATLTTVIEDMAEQIDRTGATALLLETPLDAPVISQSHAEQIGDALYDTFGDGAWSLSSFLPPRVGTLVPARVAALLGEERPDRTRIAG